MGVLVPAGQASLASSPLRQRALQIKLNGGSSAASPGTCVPNELTAGVPAHVAPVKQGALIIGELCGTPASQAGLHAGDVVTAVGASRVMSPHQLTGVMLGFKPGASVQVTWVDPAGHTHHATLVLAQAPPR